MSINPYYNPSGAPAFDSPGTSATIRAEFVAIAAGFSLLPPLPLTPNTAVVVNSGGTGFTITGGLSLAGSFATTGNFTTTLAQVASVTLTLPAVNGTLATLAGAETFFNKTLVAPALGTPTSGDLSNCTGVAPGLTAGTVQTLPNLTGPITSAGTVTSIAAQTGSGSVIVVQTSPTLVTPVLGVATASSINGLLITTTSAAHLTIASSKTLTVSNSLTMAGADGDSVVTLTGAQLLTNKTATTPAIGDNSTKVATTAAIFQAIGGGVIRSYLAGLQVSSTTNTTIVYGSGACADDTNAQMLVVTGATLNCATTGANGLDSGSLASTTTYHTFAIGKTDGTTAFLASTSPSSPTLPSGYTLKRRIGSFLTDGSAHILALIQRGDQVTLIAPVGETVVAGTQTLTGVPSGVVVTAILTIGISTGAGFGQLVVSPLAASNAIFGVTESGASGADASIAYVDTNTSAQIATSFTGSVSSSFITTIGWIDTRGRNA